ncbi:MAG: hypothetical protein QW040_02340 [Candidatus Aenigmatarchaeota archaeon]
MVRMVPRFHKKKRWKIALLWVLASIFMLLGSMVAGELQLTHETNVTAFWVAFLLALIFFLLAGLLWIAMALALRRYEE